MAVLEITTKTKLVTLIPITIQHHPKITTQVEEVVDSIVADLLLVQDHQEAVIN
jgi:hypothetical protein